MKKLRLLTLLAMALLASVSFISCGSDNCDDDFDNLENCTWNQLSKKASFLSAFPELEGTFSDGSVILNTNIEEREADMVMFTYNISSNDLDSYIQKLADNKFCVTRMGELLLTYKVANGYQYSLEYVEENFIFMAEKFLISSDYEIALEDYLESLENATQVNASWEDVVSENEWLNNMPAPEFRFTNYRLVASDEVALTGSFSASSRETYAQQLEAAGFKEMPNTDRAMFKKEFEDGGYYVVTMNEAMVDFRDFTK